MDVKQHINLDPARRASADFIVVGRLDRDDAETIWEQLFARQLTDDLFRLCCIPFFLHGMSFGDVVRAPADEHGTHVISEVAENSGHRTLRVTLRRTTKDEEERYRIRASLANSVRALGGSIEFYSDVLMAIDAPTEQSYARLRDALRRREQALELEYEESD